MRRKDWKYYAKTVQLRWHSYQFKRMKSQDSFQDELIQKRKEYKEKLQEVDLVFGGFNPFYHTYFYFENPQFFQDDYIFEKGVPVLLKTSKDKNPLLPLYYGLILQNTGSRENLEQLKAIADYTISIQQIQENGIALPYNFDYPLFGLKAPWNAGITQSLATSFFLRMSKLFEDEIYLSSAIKYFELCMKSKEMNGLLVSTPDGMEWVEEYPSSPKSYVLNGHVFAIISAIELFQVTGKEIYQHTAKQWINALVHHLPEYQYKSYLLHNLHQIKLSNIEYQGLHAGQFKHLYELTKHPFFLDLYHFYYDACDWKGFYRFYGMNE